MGLEGYHRTVERDGVSGPGEQFQMRQPEHAPLAGVIGLGVFDRTKIDYRRVEV